jgi:hypothetical protein
MKSFSTVSHACEGWIAHHCGPVDLVESNHTSRPGQRHRLSDDLLGLWNEHKDQPGGNEVE